MTKKRLVVGMSGASGAPLAVRVLRALREVEDVEVHLVATESAALTAGYECDLSFNEIIALADV